MTTRSPGSQISVLAVIVAFNQAAAIERCLESLNTQTRAVDEVLIIDNSEEPLGTPLPSIASDGSTPVRVIRTHENLGPAGGFALGLGLFKEESRWTHVWPMDDDCYPEPEALQQLLERSLSSRPGTIAFLPAVNEETGVVTSYPGWGHAPLLDRLAVTLGGLPRADLFWWIEDTEYLQHRLPRAGVAIVRAEGASIRYDLPRRGDGKPPWKYYYEVRNTIWYRLYAQRATPTAALKLGRTIMKLVASSVLRGDHRIDSLSMCVRGIFDGTRGRLGATVKPPHNKTPSKDMA